MGTLSPSDAGEPRVETGKDRALPTFREEAVAHRSRRQGPGELIKLSPGWTNWAFYSILALFVAALVAASVIEIDRYADGAAVTDPAGRVVVLLPAALAPDVAEGSLVELGTVKAAVTAFEDRVIYPPEIQSRFGLEIGTPSVAVVTSAPPEEVDAGAARVLIESKPILVALVPGLNALFGGGDG